MNDNPLKLIFKLDSNGQCTPILESIHNIPKFFQFLESNPDGEDNQSPSFEEKSKIILNLYNVIKENRSIIEFFSSNNDKSIYIYLFELYLNPKSTEELKSAIILLLNELRINVKTNKDVYIYLFNNLSLIYRGEQNENNFYNNLILLNTILGDTENCLKPRNYFTSHGHGKVIYDSDNNKKLEIGYCLTFILNFKITLTHDLNKNLSKLITVIFDNDKFIQINLKSPGSLLIKEKIVKILPQNEWINLIINIIFTEDEKLKFYFFVNGENNLTEENYDGIKLKKNDLIKKIEFFEDFNGEFTSIVFMNQMDDGDPGVLTDQFLVLFKSHKEGIWKRKILDEFILNMTKLKSLKNKVINDLKDNKDIKKKDLNNSNNKGNNNANIILENPRKLYEDIVFILTPFNYIDTCPNIIEDSLGNYHTFFYGNIRNHQYICYQNKLHSVCPLRNLLPIAEMFLLHPKLLTEKNLELYLKIIENILNYRNNNIQSTKYSKFFKILCLFLEKYPKYLFSEKILDSFFHIGKAMFTNTKESLSKTYFKHILLNEKILSKYESNLHIKFWNYIKLFCESDSSQIEKFINMNSISLLLRFYDRERYNEMCCKEHLDVFKGEYMKNKKIMNPPLNKKLSYMKDVLDVIIYCQEPKKSFYLFKLLTLDLSPCLIKFIINIFKKAFEGHKSDKEWKIEFINQLIKNKYDAIIINSFIHSLPDIRIDILEFLFQMNIKANDNFQIKYIEKCESRLKQFLFLTEIFYINDHSDKEIIKKIEINKKGNNKKDNQNKNEIKENIINKQSEEEDKKDEQKNEFCLVDDISEEKEKKEIKEIININKFEEKKNNLEKNIIINEIDMNQSADNKNKEDNIMNIFYKEKKEENHLINSKNIKYEEKNKKLVIKEEIYQNYIEKLFSIFLLWSIKTPLNIPYNTIDLKTSSISNIGALEHLFEINNKMRDLNITQKLIELLNSLMELENNCNKALYSKKFFSLLLDLSFYCYLKSQKNEKNKNIFEQYYNECRNIIIKIYINSLLYNAKTKKPEKFKFPSYELETIYIWGDNILMNELERIDTNLLHSFMDDILFELLTNFKVNFETNMEFNICDKNNNLITGYYFNNYFIFISELYHYCFQYRLDNMIYKNGLTVIGEENQKEIELPSLFVYSMRIDPNKGEKINDAWIDFRYIYEIYHRIKFLWQKDNFYKTYEKGKIKTNNKFKKYEGILQNLILNKNKKNLYKKELEFLFYEPAESNNIDIVVPIIKIIQIFLMCIISLYINKNNEKELLSWLREFKQLLRFIIVASSNLIMRDQIKFYEKVEENALYVITIGISFLKHCLNITKICKIEIEKILINNILLCLFIEKFQINYFNSHKKKRFFTSTKFNRNDLSNCAVSNLFNKHILGENDQIIFNLDIIESILTERHYYDKIRSLLISPNSDLDVGLFKNEKIIKLLNEKYFCLYSYKSIVDSRFNEIKILKDNLNYNYVEQILDLLPSYEKELAKYSNNSLEKNLSKKNLYRKIKKQLFSWNGYWSDKSKFFNNKESNEDNNIDNQNENKIIENKREENENEKNILKYKLLNHYTRSFMKPILVPILDMSYYLPNFTGFDVKFLFNHENKKIINLDIDQILKLADSQNLNNISKDKKNIIMDNEDNSIINDNINKESENKINNEDNNNINNEEVGYNYLRNIYIKSNPEVAEELLKISNNLDFGKEEEEYSMVDDRNSSRRGSSIDIPKIYFLCCLVKISHHIKGVCFVDENKLNFKVFLNQQTGKSMNNVNLAFTENDEDYDPERKTCFGSYFMFHHKDKNLYKISIKYDEIKWIFRRRYYFKNSALEIFTTQNKSFYFNFKYENDREIFLSNILKKLKDFNKIIIDLKDEKDIFDNVVGYQNNIILNNTKKKSMKKKEIGLSTKLESWKKWKISNFEFLMWLNIFSNRSYDDISQYPVFPWILTDYDDPLKIEIDKKSLMIENKNMDLTELADYKYRDLSLPMGMLEVSDDSKNRKENFIMKFEELKNESEEFEGQKPHFYGSNYSNPIYICNYMIRIFPFTHVSIELQGDKIDDPNRLFFSVKNTFGTCTSLRTDIRELIPEFFYLPEMLVNINDINLGKRDGNIIVDDVLTPCDNNPYKFIDTMKNILENNHISYNIQNWIDLIFGIKSRGKEAELANNIFSENSYQENIDLNKIEEKNIYLRTVEFGLIPTQIMSNECPRRDKKEDIKKGKEITDSNINFKIYSCKNNSNKNEKLNEEDDIDNDYKGTPIVISKVFNNDRIMLFNGSNLIEKKVNYSGFDKSFSEEIMNNYLLQDSRNRMRYYFFDNIRQSKCSLLCNQGKILILGGFYDGSITILKLANNTFKKIIPFNSEEPILALAIDEEEKYLFAGNTIGNIIIYEIDSETFELKVINNKTDQLSEISHIDVNNDLNLWSSASSNGYVNIYTMPSFKLVRSIKTKAKKLEYAFLSNSGLPSIIVINIENKNREIFSYSINGKFLKHENDEDTILSPIIIKDLNFSEYLVYILKNEETIVIRSLPFLKEVNHIDNMKNITNICASEDIKILYAISDKNEQINIVKDNPKPVVSN